MGSCFSFFGRIFSGVFSFLGAISRVPNFAEIHARGGRGPLETAPGNSIPPWGRGPFGRGPGRGDGRGRGAGGALFFLRAGGAAAGLRGARRARGAAAASRRAKAGGAGRRRGKNGAAPVRAQGACGGRGRAGRAVARRRGGRGGAGAHGAKSAGRRRGAAGRAQEANPPGARGAAPVFGGAAPVFLARRRFLGRRAKKSPFLLYKEAGFFARFSLSDQS